MRDSGHVVVCTFVKKKKRKKAIQCPRGDARALWHAKVARLQLQNEGAVKKTPSRETIG